jgi:hypothetical protein
MTTHPLADFGTSGIILLHIKLLVLLSVSTLEYGVVFRTNLDIFPKTYTSRVPLSHTCSYKQFKMEL